MARMHARRKGKSSSTRPLREKSPSWTSVSAKEVEGLIKTMASEGMQSSVIGMKLRDQYGVPDVTLLTGKSVSQIMKEQGIENKIPEDLANLMKKAVILSQHLEQNPKDLHNKRAMELTEAKIMRLLKYYKGNNVLPKDWKYSIKTAKLYVD